MLLALDISTSSIGMSIFNLEDGKLLELKFLNIRKINGLFNKAYAFREYMYCNYRDIRFSKVVIEAPSKQFAKGKTNSHTTILLVAMNAVISNICFELFDTIPVYYGVDKARAIAWPKIQFRNYSNSNEKKEVVREQVAILEPQIQWIKSENTGNYIKQNYDMADSYTVGRAFLLDGGNNLTEFI